MRHSWAYNPRQEDSGRPLVLLLGQRLRATRLPTRLAPLLPLRQCRAIRSTRRLQRRVRGQRGQMTGATSSAAVKSMWQDQGGGGTSVPWTRAIKHGVYGIDGLGISCLPPPPPPQPPSLRCLLMASSMKRAFPMSVSLGAVPNSCAACP